jgi:hypothetical protein
MLGHSKRKTLVNDRFAAAGRGFRVAVLGLAGLGAAPALAVADPAVADPAPTGRTAPDIALGLDPSSPQVAALPGGLTPAFGQVSPSEAEWRFDFHGFFTGPLNVGFGTRANPRPGQSRTVLHTPPVVPDDLETFSHTGVVPMTYAQVNFSEGNSVVTMHLNLLARQTNTSTGFLEPASQLGINDAFVAITPHWGSRLRIDILVGAFTSRYGAAGEYDEGRYGTPLIARINGVGERIAVRLALGRWLLLVEQGIHGQTNTATASITPDVWNDFADPNAGATFVSHGHVGVSYAGRATLGLHYLRAFSQDDRGVGGMAPEGSLDILAGDLRLDLGRFGHFYVATAYDDARYVGTLSRVVSVLNTRGGQGLIAGYLGGQGNGKLTTFGGQYDLSVGRLVSYPVPFAGDGPDLFVSLFGQVTRVNADDPYHLGTAAAPHKRTMDKFGLEATYSLLPWLAASCRYDQVNPDASDRAYSFAVLSPRLIFRTDWQATNQVVLQYSHWFDGSHTTVRVGDPPVEDVSVVPDANMLSLSASMWW